jgi:hypothetical protein
MTFGLVAFGMEVTREWYARRDTRRNMGGQANIFETF